MKHESDKHNFLFKSLTDLIKKVCNIASEARDNYDDLQNKVDTLLVLNQEYNGRSSQNVDISTTFGNTDSNTVGVKTFEFNSGSKLRYANILSIENQDPLEVVNFQTVYNLVFGTGDSTTFLSANGGNGTGSYSFSKNTSGDVFTFNLPVIINDTVSLQSGTVASVTENVHSLVNAQWVDTEIDGKLTSYVTYDAYRQTIQAYNNQPKFVSQKIAISKTNNSTNITSKGGKYTVTVSSTGTGPAGSHPYLNTDNQVRYQVANGIAYKVLTIKVLKYNNYATTDNSDLSWVQLFGSAPPSTIPGASNQTVIPYPKDFRLHVEFAPGGIFAGTINIPFQTPSIPVLYTDSDFTNVPTGQMLENGCGVFIDGDGDLALYLNIMEWNPIADGLLSFNLDADTANTALLTLEVDSWSYV